MSVSQRLKGTASTRKPSPIADGISELSLGTMASITIISLSSNPLSIAGLIGLEEMSGTFDTPTSLAMKEDNPFGVG